MKRGFRDQIRALGVLVISGIAVSGCDQVATLLETNVLPVPAPPSGKEGLPQAYARSQINDPGLRRFAWEFEQWALQRKTVGVSSSPVFKRVEVLPPTRTVLPYGVGAYQQEPRLPVILTVGAGWAKLNPNAKEAIAAQVFERLSQGLEALRLDPALRPTLTIQTPSGLELTWMNDLTERWRNIHGDDSPPLPSTAIPPPSRLPSAPPPPAPMGRGKILDGNEH